MQAVNAFERAIDDADCVTWLSDDELSLAVVALARNWSDRGQRPLMMRGNPSAPSVHVDRRARAEDFFAETGTTAHLTNDVVIEVAANHTLLVGHLGENVETYCVYSKRTTPEGALRVEWATGPPVRP